MCRLQNGLHSRRARPAPIRTTEAIGLERTIGTDSAKSGRERGKTELGSSPSPPGYAMTPAKALAERGDGVYLKGWGRQCHPHPFKYTLTISSAAAAWRAFMLGDQSAVERPDPFEIMREE